MPVSVFSREIPCTFEAHDELLSEADAFLVSRVGPGDLADRALLLLSEAISNAIEHGNGLNPEKTVRVFLSAEAQVVQANVSHRGLAFSPPDGPADLPEDLLASRGRGMPLMHMLADELHFSDDGRSLSFVTRADAA